MFKSFIDFKKGKCPKCKSKIEQVYETLRFKIKGYSYENEYKGKTMYRDTVKDYEKKLKSTT